MASVLVPGLSAGVLWVLSAALAVTLGRKTPNPAMVFLGWRATRPGFWSRMEGKKRPGRRLHLRQEWRSRKQGIVVHQDFS